MVTWTCHNVIHMLPVLLISVTANISSGANHTCLLHINSNSFGQLSVSQKTASPVVVPYIGINSKNSSITYQKIGYNCKYTLEAVYYLSHLGPQPQLSTWSKNFYNSILINPSNCLIYTAYVQTLFPCPLSNILVGDMCITLVWDSRHNCWQHTKLLVMTVQHI